jgi:hypothetical protein
MMETEGAERGELSLLKEREMKVRDILSKMSKSHRERDTLMGQLKKNFEKTDEFMREMLNEETAVIVNDFYRVVVEWWNSRLEEVGNTEASTAIKSNVLWTQFKKENPNMQTEMDVGMFKEILCGFLGGDKVVKPKTKGGALDIHGYRLKP